MYSGLRNRASVHTRRRWCEVSIVEANSAFTYYPVLEKKKNLTARNHKTLVKRFSTPLGRHFHLDGSSYAACFRRATPCNSSPSGVPLNTRAASRAASRRRNRACQRPMSISRSSSVRASRYGARAGLSLLSTEHSRVSVTSTALRRRIDPVRRSNRGPTTRSRMPGSGI